MRQRYFELAPHVGLNPDGSPQPFVQEGFRMMVEERDEYGRWRYETRTVRLGPAIPGSRITCTDDPPIAACLEASEKWREIDPPKALRPRRPRQALSPRRRK